MAGFDLDEFLSDCAAAVVDSDPTGAVGAVLDRVGSDPSSVVDALGQPSRGNLDVLHHAADCTILHVVWTPGMRIEPHDHRMAAGIVVYGGTEDNAFFRRTDDGGIEGRGGRVLEAGDVCLLGPDVIHRVEGHPDQYTGALHVYRGDFFDRVRSTWSEETGAPTVDERPVAQLFADAEAVWQTRRT